MNHDREFLHSEDTRRWLDFISGPTPLFVSQYRLLTQLRELNTSARELALATGMPQERVRVRLRQMLELGFVEVVDTLGDKTQIWGLVEPMRKPEAPTYPTEAAVTARRSRQSGVLVVDIPPVTKATIGRPRKDVIDYEIFRPYIAKEPIK